MWIVFISLTCLYLANSYHLLQGSRRRYATSIGSKFIARPIPMAFGLNGGKMVVSGVGDVEDDEFFLNLLNEQNVWDPVVLATTDENATKKRFLSRTARYSGLLNILNIVNADIRKVDELKSILEDASSWIAFNVSRDEIVPLSKSAIESNVKRVIFTTTLPKENVNDTQLPEFTEAIALFQSAGGQFTGIRHGDIIPGNEDHDYDIVNATLPCAQPFIERGVLARLVAELLQIEKAGNIECGVSSSGEFAGAYLDVLRSTGLTRREEVERVLNGGIKRMDRLRNERIEKRKLAIEKIKEKEALREKLAEEKYLQESKRFRELTQIVNTSKDPRKDDDDEDAVITETYEEMVTRRQQEILQSVWREYNARMYTKGTNKDDFFENNKDKAKELAEQEVAEYVRLKKEREADTSVRDEIYNRLVESNRKKYAKLLALEKKEMEYQKEQSDIWVRFVYLLLEYTMSYCAEKDILFYNLDEFAQTRLLLTMSNDLRKMANIPSYDLVYDSLDASVIIEKLKDSDLGKKYGLMNPVDDILSSLNVKYGSVLKSVKALRSVLQVIEAAIETLQKELPPPPPTVNEARQAESLAKQKQVSKERLESIRNRGKPQPEDESVVGRL